MDPNVTQGIDVLTRWLHVLAGVVWVGHLYFFNFVNALAMKNLDAETKKKVVPELMPRALYFFRWAALFTWLTGILLLSLVFHMGGLMIQADAPPSRKGMAIGISFTVILLGFFLYDVLAKVLKGKDVVLAPVGLALIAGLSFGFAQLMTGRAMFLHVGAVLGSVMMMNVWMRIWKAQKKIIRGLKGVDAPAGDEWPALAAARSKHNVYLSVPVLFFMVSGHTAPLLYGDELAWVWSVAVVAVGWGFAKFLFFKAGTAAPTAAP